MITLYTRNNPPCSYCEQAKNLLRQKQAEHKIYVVGEDLTKEEMLKRIPNARSFPVIFVDSTFIGGLSELKNYFLSREMEGVTI